jgi:type I restriction enzyme S subunit
VTNNITGNHEIPNNWKWVELDQLCDITSGNPAPQDKNLFKNGKVPFVRVQDMGRMGNNVYLLETRDYLNNEAAVKNNMKLFPKGSVLFTKSGMSILLNQRAILGSEMHVVSHIGICLLSKFTLSEWIYYWLKSIDFKDLTHATTLPSLKLSKVQKIKTPLPPLQEQHRIVAKIEELFTKLDAGVESLKQVQAQLKRYRQSVLKAAVEGRLTAEWREQHKDELESADTSLERMQNERKSKLVKKYKDHMLVDTSDMP